MSLRSPNYPAIGLNEAIRLAHELYRAEKRSPASAAVAVAAWGYSGVNGAARSRLSALRKYGLLEKSGGAFKLTNRAMNLILHEDGSPEFLVAAREAARAPQLFRALADDFLEGSETNLRNHLMLTLDFTESGARQVTKAFKETMATAKLTQMPSDLSEEDMTPGDADEGSAEAAATRVVDGSVHLTASGSLTAKGDVVRGGLLFSWPLSRGVTAEVRLSGGEVLPQHIDMLSKYLAIAKIALQADDEPSASSTIGEDDLA